MFALIHWLEQHMLACPYKQLVGFDCPGCGMQRSFIELLKGDLVASFHFYPALLPVIFTLLYTFLHLVFSFKNGAMVIKFSYLGTMLIVILSYVLKMLR